MRLLHRADCLHQREGRNGDRQIGNLRAGPVYLQVRRRRRGHPQGQRQRIRPRRRSSLRQHPRGRLHIQENQSGNGLQELLQRLRRQRALRRIQELRHRPRDGRVGPKCLPVDKDSHREDMIVGSIIEDITLLGNNSCIY